MDLLAKISPSLHNQLAGTVGEKSSRFMLSNTAQPTVSEYQSSGSEVINFGSGKKKNCGSAFMF